MAPAVRPGPPDSSAPQTRDDANLSSGVAEIHHAYLVRGTDGEERYAEVVVTGPGELVTSHAI